MALKQLQSLVLRVAATAVDNGTGLDGKFQSMRKYPAFLSYPRPYSPEHRMAETDVWPRQGSADNCGTARAVTRAGRPGCSAGITRTSARTSRGTIQSRWSRPLGTTATLSLGLAQVRMSLGIFGTAKA